MYIYAGYKRGFVVKHNEYNDGCDKPTIGERLVFCREQEELSIEDVARYLRRKPEVVSAYEQNRRELTFEDLFLLALLYMRCMDFFCHPFEAEYFSKGSMARVLMKFTRYIDKFYNAPWYFPPESEHEAIVEVSDYAICPVRNDLL